MEVYYFNRTRNKKAEKDLGVKFVSVRKICKISDFIILTLPLNKITEKFFDNKKFALMKPSAYFINTSRGPIVNENTLINALKDKRNVGAGIDVFAKEPPSQDNPLFKLDNIIITHHSAANTRNAIIEMAMVVKDVTRVLEGEEPKYPANNPKNNIFP